ncbi:MAG: hypothetical protein ACOY5W_10095 [Pseudomonadota bacterium]
MDVQAILYFVLAVAAIATLAYLLHNKYVLRVLYAIALGIWFYTRFPEIWSNESYAIYHKLGLSITLIVTSLFGLVLAIEVVRSATPDVVVGTKSSILSTRLDFGLLNLFAPIISMMVCGYFSVQGYLHAIK